MSDHADRMKKELVQAFLTEARNQVETILANLVQLESADDATKTALIEQTFREMHNLKGSAKGVGYRTISALCHPLEDLLSSLKRNQLSLSEELIECLISSVVGLEKFIDNPDLEMSPAEMESEKAKFASFVTGAVVATENIVAVRISEATADGAIADTSGGADEAALAAAGLTERRSKPRDRRLSGHSIDEIRISATKLERLLQKTEELIPARLMAGRHAQLLHSLAARLEESNRTFKGKVMQERVGIAKLDALVDASGGALEAAVWNNFKEMLTEQSRLIERLSRECLDLAHGAGDLSYLADGSVEALIDESRSMLMMPSASIFGSIPMMVRQLSRDLEKEVELEIVGQEIELDKRILAGLRDPLVHLIRNSVDHGIELPDVRLAQGKARRGKLSLAVNQLGGGLVEFIISDDGSGIDCQEICRVAQQSGMLTEEEILAMSEEEKLMLIFRSSLSTSRIVTEISGRGLGMAVVEENVAKLGGRLKVLSEVGIGTQIVLTLPAALATFSGLQVSVSAKTFLLPCTGIDRVLRVPKSSVSLVEGEFPSFILDDRLVPICFLGDLLQLERVSWSDTVDEHFNIVLIGEGEHSVAFVVDSVSEEQEVLLKPLGAPFQGLSIYLGVTLLGIGKLAPVLNPRELINVYLRQRTASSGSIALFEQADAKSPAVRSQKSVLVVDDTLTARMLLTNILASGGFAVTTAADGVEALAIMANTNFDLVITDLEMPNMNGFELTQAIKQLSSTPVIIVTSMSSREERERGVAVGANAYFVKGSFDQTNLLEVIAALI